MTADRPETPLPHKLLAAPATKIRLALASLLILGVGALLAPRAAPRALSTPQERAAPLLEQQVQPRQVVQAFTGVADVAARVGQHAVAIAAPDRTTPPTVNDFADSGSRAATAGFGVFVSDGQVLTHASALHGRSTMQVETAGSGFADARVAAYEPSTGLVLLQTEGTGASAPPLASGPLEAGALVIGAARQRGRSVAAPLFITSVDDDRYGLGAGTAVLPGMPLYTLDGELFAIAAGDGPGGHAFAVAGAATRLTAAAASGRRPGAFGLSFQPIAHGLVPAFGEQGVLISDVVEGGPAAAAGLAAGDVLLAVGDVPVGSVDAAARALSAIEAGTTTALRTMRGGRSRFANLTPSPAYDVAALARAAARPAAGLEARLALSAATLAAAEIPPSARVLTVAGRPATSRAQVQAELRRVPAPVPVLVRHDGRQYFVPVTPAR